MLPNQDHNHLSSHTHLCWRSAIAGVFVSLLVYGMLSALGAGIGGFSVAHILDRNESGSGLLAGAGIWLTISTVISLFLGSYFATRYSSARHKQIGAAQGILISAAFFFVTLHVSGQSLGNLAMMAGNVTGATVSGGDASDVARLIGDAGWTLFASFFLGIIASIFGGIEGTLGNRKRPFAQVL